MNSDLAIGLHIVGFLAALSGKPITSEILAETYGTSPVVVRRVLARLTRAGLVETRRGLGGGSVLAQNPAEVNLRQVYEAVTGTSQILRRHPGDESGVAKILANYINDLYSEAEEALMRRLESVTIEEMTASVKPSICKLLSKEPDLPS